MTVHYDPAGVSDQQLLERVSSLRFRDSLSRTTSEAKARMAKAGVPAADWADLTVAEHLELLQTQRWLELRFARRNAGVSRALQAGATWAELSEVLGIDADRLRASFRDWIAGQRQLYRELGIGLSDAQAEVAEGFLAETSVAA